MQPVIRIGSRESRLAVVQAEIVRNKIQEVCPEAVIEIITMKTTGDKILDQSLEKIGGKGLFVKELDQALLEGRIDLAVHSLKDMPAAIPKELPILAYIKREDPRDVLVYRPGEGTVPEEGLIGTSSRRRMVQLKKLYPGRRFAGIRGNVKTRLYKLDKEGYDATILAAAGLIRLGMQQVIGRYFSVDEVIPAAGQGVLAVQGRKGETPSWIEKIGDPDTRSASLAERQFTAELGGDCTSPAAAFADVRQGELKLTGLYFRESDESSFVESICGEKQKARQLGELLARRMKKTYGV